MNSEEVAMILLSIGSSSESNEQVDSNRKRKRYEGLDGHTDEGCIITKSSGKFDNPILKDDMIRYYVIEVDALIKKAQEQSLIEVASWFIKNKEALCVLHDPQYTYIAPGHTPPGPSRYHELMHTAATHDRKDVMEFLCRLEYNINLHDQELKTPLGLCVEQGKIELVKYLLDQGVDVNKDSCYYMPLLNGGRIGGPTAPLNIAIAENNLEVALLLRSRGGYIPHYSGKMSWLSSLSINLKDNYKTKYDIPA